MIDHQFIEAGEMPDHFDFHAPMLDLPMLLGTTLQSVPAPDSYLGVPEDLDQKWRERLGESDGLGIGLVWAGDPKHKNDKNRSIDPALLAPLLQLDGVKVFSLQVGRGGEAISTLGPQIDDLAPELTTFCETAAAMMNLDVIVSIDSSPAHLAGALGRPVWTLLPYMPDWRWMLEGNTSPW